MPHWLALTFLGLGLASAEPVSDPVYLTILGPPESFAREFVPMPPESPRQIAFGLVLYALNTPVPQLVAQTEQALDTAERTGYPVLIHLDDWNYPAPSSDPAIVEWSAFPAEGETHGPVVRRRWINWGSWFTVEAPPNYESPAFRADVAARYRAVAETVAARLARWQGEGRAYLLAGLVVGWESGYYTMPDFRPGPRPTAGDESLGDDEILRSGYAALTARGHAAASVRARAETEGKSETRVLHELMVGVVRDYTAFLAGACRAAGVPRERIYTHYTGLGSMPEERIEPILREDGRNMPLTAAVNEESRPGITATLPWGDVEGAARAFREAGRMEWGAVEVEFTDVTRSEPAAAAYLDALTASGARVICIYGWWEPEDHPFGVRGSGAVPAMKAWLAGP